MSKHEEPTPNAIVGQQVHRLRVERQWSAETLAQRLGRELDKEVPGYIARRLEKGERPITADEIAALATIFGVSESALFGAESEETFYRQLQFKSLKDREATGRSHIRQGVQMLEEVAADARLFLDHYRDLPVSTAGTLRAIAFWAEETVKANSPDEDGPVAQLYRPDDDVPKA